MKIKQLPTGQWYGTIWLGKKRVRKWGSNRKQLEELLTKLSYEFQQFKITPDRRNHARFSELSEAYFRDHVAEGEVKSKNTSRSQIDCFQAELCNGTDPYIREVTTDDVEKWMKKYAKKTTRTMLGPKQGRIEVPLSKPIATSSIRRKFNTLKAIFNWGIKKGYLRDNPCKAADVPRAAQVYPRYLELAEIRGLLKGCPKERFWDYCFLMLHTGMRPSEGLGLVWEDVDLENRLIYILDQKNGDKDTITIDDELYAWFLRRTAKGRSGQVLVGYTEFMLGDDAEDAIKAAGINRVRKPGMGKFTIYGLRHTFASHLLMAGEKIETVAKMLRHKDINITYSHYGHLTQRYLQDAAKKINLVPLHSTAEKVLDSIVVKEENAPSVTGQLPLKSIDNQQKVSPS